MPRDRFVRETKASPIPFDLPSPCPERKIESECLANHCDCVEELGDDKPDLCAARETCFDFRVRCLARSDFSHPERCYGFCNYSWAGDELPCHRRACNSASRPSRLPSGP